MNYYFVIYDFKGCHAERSEASGLIKERFFGFVSDAVLNKMKE
jgi:hypothetical protein